MAEMSYWDMIKMSYRFLDFKFQQWRLTTRETQVIETAKGPVRGVKRISIYGDEYYSFEGIPFAKPPLGELRFRAPEPAEPWTEVRDCYYAAEKPLQPNLLGKATAGSEDCLYLNVYTKNLNPDKPMPVMIWIYGGGFQVGEASRRLYSPDFFMKENVVLITIAYRLGPLGFLSLNDPEVRVPGNAGLKDQVMGLRWSKDNCSRFGGDVNNITVFGESAGGASTHYMAITEQTKGLFHKAIIQSGSALAHWANAPQNNWAVRLAKAVGYKGEENDKEIFEFLSKASGASLLKATERLTVKEEKRNRILFAFAPVIETYVGNDCVIPKDPRLMLAEAWSNQIPVMIGGVSFEGLLFHPEMRRRPKTVDEVEDCEYLVPLELGLDRNSEKCKELGLKLKQAHFGDKTPCWDTLFEFLDLLSYMSFWHPIHRTLLSRQTHSSAPTFLYRFDLDSEYFNHIRNLLCGKNVRGTCHGDELGYLFHQAFGYRLDPNTIEYKTIERMIATWTSFAMNSDPNNEKLEGAKFEPIPKEDTQWKCVNFAEEVKVIELPEQTKLAVWDELYPKDRLF